MTDSTLREPWLYIFDQENSYLLKYMIQQDILFCFVGEVEESVRGAAAKVFRSVKLAATTNFPVGRT